MQNTKYILFSLLALLMLYFGSIVYQKFTSKIYNQENMKNNEIKLQELEGKIATNTLQKIVFAGGCFWCTEASYNNEYGVETAVSGYFGGKFKNPTYEQIGNQETDHREAVQIYFNTSSTSLKKLLVNYWTHIDPTQVDGQFADVGPQYKTAIYYFSEKQKLLAEESKKLLEESKKFQEDGVTKKIVVEILDGRGLEFYPAEEYHQDYSKKNPVRYEYYKKGSGRTDFIKNNWKDDKTFEKFLKL